MWLDKWLEKMGAPKGNVISEEKKDTDTYILSGATVTSKKLVDEVMSLDKEENVRQEFAVQFQTEIQLLQAYLERGEKRRAKIVYKRISKAVDNLGDLVHDDPALAQKLQAILQALKEAIEVDWFSI